MLLISVSAAVLYALASWEAMRSAASNSLRLLVPAALALHAVALLGQTFHGGVLQVGVAEFASLLAWQSALILWLVCLREPLQTLGIANYPLAAACVLWPALAGNHGNPATIQDWTTGLHILFSLLSAGVLTLAAIHAVGLAILDRILHQPGNLARARRLPPLQTMERLLFGLVFSGFFLLSLTLLSGLLLNQQQRDQPLSLIVLSIGAWLMFGLLIFGRLRYGWRGRSAIRWVLSGYGMLVAAYFGTKLVLEPIVGTHLG